MGPISGLVVHIRAKERDPKGSKELPEELGDRAVARHRSDSAREREKNNVSMKSRMKEVSRRRDLVSNSRAPQIQP